MGPNSFINAMREYGASDDKIKSFWKDAQRDDDHKYLSYDEFVNFA